MDPVTERTLTTGWLAQADPTLRQALLEAGRIRHFVDGAMIYGFEQDQICLWGVMSGVVRILVA